jgi:glycosyltransferase involved in cell wall biosynthesis
VEYLRWWDDQQRGDLIHYFGRPTSDYIGFAHAKNIKVIMAPLLTGLGSRSEVARRLQRVMMSNFETFFPRMIVEHFKWDSFLLADRCIALTEWEAYLMRTMFRAASEKIEVMPNGVEPVFFNNVVGERNRWLICTATITARKRVLELGQAAVIAQVPLWIIGKAYAESDPYASQFFELSRNNPDFIRYEGAITDREKLARVYQQARGFVLLSTVESLSLSALEAAASGCPLLLSELPWARCVFKETASYCSPKASIAKTAEHLKKFHENANALPLPPKPKTWKEVAHQLKTIYEKVLNTS